MNAPDTWKGTPIPPLDDPIEPTPELAAIAGRIWWHGPAEIALRNANAFIRQVVEYANEEDTETVRRSVSRERWIHAITTARPGQISRRSAIFWRTELGRPTEEIRRTWPRNAHRNDIAPLAGETREHMYERHRRARARRERNPNLP